MTDPRPSDETATGQALASTEPTDLPPGVTKADVQAAVEFLRDPATIRARCETVLVAGENGGLSHFAVMPERLEATAEFVVSVIRHNHPKLNVPYHSRWRHFVVDGIDRAGFLDRGDRDRSARARMDLAVVSVLLDAGAGPDWRYRDAQGRLLSRSEGLAIASLDMFRGGLFSANPADPWRVDAERLLTLTAAELGAGFQVRDDNPLVGLSGRLALMHGLGRACQSRSDLFAGGDGYRPGHLLDHLRGRMHADAVAAADILAAILSGLGSIWPGRVAIAGINLGDVWPHPAAGTVPGAGAGLALAAGLVPLHKLSQWLTYSLVEPLQAAGVTVSGLDDLTGLAEYRNGGLFVDMGVLVPRHPDVLGGVHEPGSEIIIEWRALTVALLDRLAVRVRALLDKDARQMPLPCILEGGTWAAGRMMARKLRPGGPPPIKLASDGTVF